MNQQTLQQMNTMRLYGMAASFKGLLESHGMDKMTTDQTVSTLLQAEWEDRENKKITRNIQNAKFRYQATIEGIDYSHPRNLDKNQLMRFQDCSFIKKAENILISGATGVGKSYIASALGYQACIMGYKVYYCNLQKQFNRLKVSKADGSYLKEMERIEKQDLLIIDDFGLQTLDNNASLMLLEIIEDRYGKRSTIIASQLTIDKWYDICSGKTVADAIFDRILHGSHKIQLNGDTMRKKK